MRRAPAKPVRACTLRNWCLVSHVTFEAPLHTSHLTVFTLHTTHFTLHSSHCTLRTSRSTLFTLHTALFALQTSHFTLRTSQSTLHTALLALQASHFTVHTSHCTLHLIWALLTLSQLSSSHLISSHMSSKLSWITSQYYYKGTCMRSAPARPVRACFVRSCCNVVVQEHDLRASPVQCNVKQALSSHITLHPSHFTSQLFSSGFMSSHMSAAFFLAMFMSSERSSNFLMRWTYFQLISALLHVSKVERNSCRFFYMPKGVDHKIFTILRLLMPSVDALHQIATASVNMV